MEEKTKPQRNEITDARRKELDNFQRALDMEGQNTRMDDGRMGRCIALFQREAEMEKDFQEAEENRAKKSDTEAMEHGDNEKMDRSAQYCKDLQHQLVSRQHQRQCEHEDTLIENKMIEEVNRTMRDEDKRELQKKRVQTEKLHQEMITSEQDRMAWKDKQKEMIANEDEQLEYQWQFSSGRSSDVIAERDHKIQMKDDHNQKIGAKTFSDQEDRLERENVIELHQMQECLEQNVQEDHDKREKKMADQKELKEGLSDQIERKKFDVLQQEHVDADFQKQSDAMMAVGDQRERERLSTIRDTNRQYSKDLRQQIEDNAQRRAIHKQQENSRDQKAEVDEGHNKMEAEHVAHVLESLQAGTLHTSDFPAHNEDDRKSPELDEQDIDPVTHSSPVHRRVKCNAQCRILREY